MSSRFGDGRTFRRPTPDKINDRRSSRRLPIERDVRYTVIVGKRKVAQVGLGKTLNISSAGVLCTTECALREGVSVELAVNWPALLKNSLPLKLVIIGHVVRPEETQ